MNHSSREHDSSNTWDTHISLPHDTPHTRARRESYSLHESDLTVPIANIDLLIATCRTKLSACQFLVRSFPLFRTHRVSNTRHYQGGRLVLTPLSSCGRGPDVERTMGIGHSITFERGRRKDTRPNSRQATKEPQEVNNKGVRIWMSVFFYTFSSYSRRVSLHRVRLSFCTVRPKKRAFFAPLFPPFACCSATSDFA